MDGVVVLLVDCSDKLEVADSVALGLLGTEEGDGGLWWYGSTSGDLAGSDQDEAVALGLPSKVDNGVLDGINNLNRHALFPDAENLEVGSQRLLRLGVTIDLDAEEVGV